jgi:hypothetical protein
MTTAIADTPDGERLAGLETRAEHLEQQAGQIREDIRDGRAEIRDVRSEVSDLRAKVDRNLLWTLGVIITMWVSLAAMWVTSMLTVLNKLEG